MVETRRAAVGMLVDEKRRFEADAVDVFDDVLGDSLLAAATTPVRTPVRRTQSEPVSRRGWFSFLRSPKTPAAPPATPLAGALAKARAVQTTRSRRLKSAQRGAEKVERALSIARRHLDDARRDSTGLYFGTGAPYVAVSWCSDVDSTWRATQSSVLESFLRLRLDAPELEVVER